MRWRWPPRKLVRILLQHFLAAHAHDVERLFDQVVGLRPALGQLEVLDHHVEDVAHAVEWVVDGVGILEDRLHLAPVFDQLRLVHRGDVDALVDDLPARDLGKAQDQVGQRRLAAAALTGDRRDRGRPVFDRHAEILQRHRRGLRFHEAAAIHLGGVAYFQ